MRELSRLSHQTDPVAHRKCLLDLSQWKRASTILLYNPLPGEVDLMPLIKRDDPHRFLFPRIEGEHLALYRPFGTGEWITHPLGVLEPDPETWEKASPGEIDLALIPGLAFDPQGGRLGRGRGFYDRLLGDPDFRGVKIGICWRWQLVDSIPLETHDIRMDLIISGEK